MNLSLDDTSDHIWQHLTPEDKDLLILGMQTYILELGHGSPVDPHDYPDYDAYVLAHQVNIGERQAARNLMQRRNAEHTLGQTFGFLLLARDPAGNHLFTAQKQPDGAYRLHVQGAPMTIATAAAAIKPLMKSMLRPILFEPIKRAQFDKIQGG